MRAVVQRVSQARVLIKSRQVAKIGPGFLVLLGVGKNDEAEKVKQLAKKIVGLRVMADKEGKMNNSLQNVSGQMLVVSQFTLYADTKKGNRPSFINAADPVKAKDFYNLFIKEVESLGIKVEQGVFQAFMQVELSNDGPVTIILES